MSEENKHKYDFLSLLLSEGDAMLCLDARNENVDVPKEHKTNPSLNLVLNLNFKRPLDIKPEGVYVTLSFNGRIHSCIIPFDSVWAIYDPSMKKGQVWEESLPPDLLTQPQNLKTVFSQPEKTPVKAKPRRKNDVSGPAGRSKRERSHLRVIK